MLNCFAHVDIFRFTFVVRILGNIVVSMGVNFNPETTEALQINILGMIDLFFGK